MTFELGVELRYVDSSSMVENGIKSFEDTLLGKIHLIDEEPMSLLNGL